MSVTIDPNAYIIGAADVYYRAIGGTGPWLSVGATVDDIVFRVNQTIVNPSENFNGVLSKVKGMDYKSKEDAECEVTMPEIAGAKFPLVVPGAVVTTNVAADAAVPDWPADTLDGAVAAGATTITVTTGGAAVGDIVHISSGTVDEYRVLDVVAGMVYSFRDPLINAFADGAAVTQASNDGKTEITPGTTRRLPDSAYHDFVLVAQSPTDYYELYLYNCVSSTDQAELSFGNETMAAIKATLGTRWDGTPGTLAWRLRVPA